MHKLVIEDDEGKTVVVPLIRDEITIGRQEGNTIRLTERNVSRRHAKLVRREGHVFVEDLSSYLGTKINGELVTGARQLADGDRFQIGDYRLSIKEERLNHTARYGEPVTATAPVLPTLPSTQPPLPPMAMVPEGVIEGAPTIPVRTLNDQSFVGPLATAPVATLPPARLVVMSTPMAGAQFTLDRASLVIGRTPENDVVLNHKSISRHHAKVIRDGDRYVVVDLESANGVRVNGTEFERVELHGGDMLELGHVRVRFVSGNESYVDDGQLLSMPGGSRKPLLIGGVALVAVVALVFFMVSGDKPAKSTPPVAATPQPAAPTITPTPPVVTPPEPSGEAAELLATARAALTQEKFTEALAALDKAAATGPVPGLDELRQNVESERDSAGQFAAVKRATVARDYEALLAAYRSIPDESMYKDRARPLHDDLRTKYVALHLAAAAKRAVEGNCDEARRQADLVLAVDDGNAAASSVAGRCEANAAAKLAAARTATAPRPTPVPRPAARVPAVAAAATRPAPAPKAAAVVPSPPDEEPAGRAADADALIQQAQDAWLRGQYAAAIDSSRRALRVRPNLSRAHQIIAVCSCSLRDAGQAAKAYEKLDEKAKQLVRGLCQRSGITLE